MIPFAESDHGKHEAEALYDEARCSYQFAMAILQLLLTIAPSTQLS